MAERALNQTKQVCLYMARAGDPKLVKHVSLTWLQAEEYAYPRGGQTRKGRAFFPDGKIRRVWVGIADTMWTAPAHGWAYGHYFAGFVTSEGEAHNLVFHVPVWNNFIKSVLPRCGE